MDKVVDIELQRPHLVVTGLVNTHVIPESLIQKVIDGDKDITEIEDYYDFLPTILKEWLNN